ncbi:MAG: hypothetical protein ACRCUE_00160 [Bosea sp. (in: a-proteobacteria)]
MTEVKVGGAVLGYREKARPQAALPPRLCLTLRLQAEVDRLYKWRSHNGELQNLVAVLEAHRATRPRGRWYPSGSDIGRILNVHLVEIIAMRLSYLHAVDETPEARKARQNEKKRSDDAARVRRKRMAACSNNEARITAKDLAKAAGVSRATHYRRAKVGRRIVSQSGETENVAALIYIGGRQKVSHIGETENVAQLLHANCEAEADETRASVCNLAERSTARGQPVGDRSQCGEMDETLINSEYLITCGRGEVKS